MADSCGARPVRDHSAAWDAMDQLLARLRKVGYPEGQIDTEAEAAAQAARVEELAERAAAEDRDEQRR
ncbi:hypothetical protein GCM10011574_67950 [Microbispora bryophytorum]|uniref:Uncharacterized protein n=1 Tax=Microbispora bryophytorum TaxID=1460882 RepID=A0A8H9LEL4_9ACTN|nr:hypothetical protein GCM10011574_67950 [Microbispora bryophytorum]